MRKWNDIPLKRIRLVSTRTYICGTFDMPVVYVTLPALKHSCWRIVTFLSATKETHKYILATGANHKRLRGHYKLYAIHMCSSQIGITEIDRVIIQLRVLNVFFICGNNDRKKLATSLPHPVEGLWHSSQGPLSWLIYDFVNQ